MSQLRGTKRKLPFAAMGLVMPRTFNNEPDLDTSSSDCECSASDPRNPVIVRHGHVQHHSEVGNQCQCVNPVPSRSDDHPALHGDLHDGNEGLAHGVHYRCPVHSQQSQHSQVTHQSQHSQVGDGDLPPDHHGGQVGDGDLPPDHQGAYRQGL